MRCKGEGLGEGSAIPAIFTLESEQGVLSKVCVVCGKYCQQALAEQF